VLTIEQLKQAVHKKGLTKTDTALLCVAAGGAKGVSTLTAKTIGQEAGVKGWSKVNLSAHLGSAEEKVFKTPAGWELTDAGRAHVSSLAALSLALSPAAHEAQTLRKLLPKLKDDDAKAFLTEAIVCAEQSLFRAAVVLSWVGAVAILHDTVVDSHLAAFNAAAAAKHSKWKEAKTTDDIAAMKEAQFLELLQSISMIGKNVRQELDSCLQLRNGCGHPTSLKIGANKVAAHLESLALNVYAVFG
jgi:hypothetical protein